MQLHIVFTFKLLELFDSLLAFQSSLYYRNDVIEVAVLIKTPTAPVHHTPTALALLYFECTGPGP